jgi:hypothetical protein
MEGRLPRIKIELVPTSFSELYLMRMKDLVRSEVSRPRENERGVRGGYRELLAGPSRVIEEVLAVRKVDWRQTHHCAMSLFWIKLACKSTV